MQQGGVVEQSQVETVVERLKGFKLLSLDTETTGLSPYHGDRLFSIIIACSKEEAYYFNFNEYEGVSSNWVLDKSKTILTLFNLLNSLNTLDRVWFMHNAPFDLAMLRAEGVDIVGTVHDTQAIARVAYNNHMTYGLDACAERIGEEKSDAVEEYIKKEKLWEWEEIPGKKVRDKKKYFNKVPFDIIAPYGLTDAKVTFALGISQRDSLEASSSGDLRTCGEVYRNELRLVRTISRIENQGIRVDKEYSKRAIVYEGSRAAAFEVAFQNIAGIEFSDSPKVLADCFSKLGITLPLTDKGNPSTKSDVLKYIDHPICSAILGHRDAKSKMDFYNGFLHHADHMGRIHPKLIAGGTATGRFASREPNFQNLTNEEDEDLSTEFLVRRAIIPTDGTFFFCPDYDQMEYRLMLDYAKEMGLIRKILQEGLDIHEATGQMMGVPRKTAKTINFMLLYGGGYNKLALALKISPVEAKALRSKYFSALPYVSKFIQEVMYVAKTRGYIRNWMGRVSFFPNPEFSYSAPNYLIQGGCADVVKKAMNELDDLLSGTGSRMILQVHDELLFEIKYGEEYLIPYIRNIMQAAYPHKYIPLTVGSEVAYKSWADKEKYVAAS